MLMERVQSCRRGSDPEEKGSGAGRGAAGGGTGLQACVSSPYYTRKPFDGEMEAAEETW